jgi:hypothetical protein
MITRSRDLADFGDFGDFGDVGIASFGNATKRKLKRPYKRSVVRKGRKLTGKHKIGHVPSNKSEFKWVTRGGSVYAAKVSKGRKAPKKAARKAPKRKPAKRARKK